MNLEDKTYVQKVGLEPFWEQNHLQNLLRTQDQTTSNDKTIQQHFFGKKNEGRTKTRGEGGL